MCCKAKFLAIYFVNVNIGCSRHGSINPLKFNCNSPFKFTATIAVNLIWLM